jgi:predicted dinucleotide-binding enzyme
LQNGREKGNFEETAKFGEIIVFAIKGSTYESALKLIGISNQDGKTVIDPKFPDGKPTMFICGNNDSAKSEVKEVLDKFG